ncbi:MAG: response regulator [Lachnospiraceae bacterium]|nr:response regulator [Lachnospiraceae bacterium]
MREKLHILIANSNHKKALDFKRFLEEKDEIEQVYLAEDGLEACRMIMERKPDIVLLDVILPELDGLGVLERINTEWKAESRPAFIFVTSVSTQGLVECAMKLGASYFVLRPFYPDGIYRRMLQIKKCNSSMHNRVEVRANRRVSRPYTMPAAAAAAVSDFQMKTDQDEKL